MPGAQPVALERRAFPRHRVFKRCKVLFNGSKSVIDGMLRDLSEGGARIACGQAAGLPQEFQLFFVAERELRDVRIAWRDSEQVGVEFRSAPRKALNLHL